jgi:D-serine deaminase-like pyridoxal phosphate-dependent protein
VDLTGESESESRMASEQPRSPTMPATPARPSGQFHQPASEPATRDYSFYRRALLGRTLPCAFVDLDLLDQNMRAVVSRANGKRIRVASKSVRCVTLLRRILAADPAIQGVMCFTAREAAYLASLGFDDLLIGYPCWHAADIAAVARATADGARITLMVDSVAQVEQIERVAAQYDARLPLCLDSDMAARMPGLHFGAWRSPLRTPEQARPVIERIVASKRVWLDGIMGYEAQIAGLGDNYPGHPLKNTLVGMLKGRSAREVSRRRAALIEQARSLGAEPRFVNGGGTGSMRTTGAESAVTEITVGSGFYSPGLFDNYRDFRYQPAAGFAIEIVRQASPTIYTCLGGGYVASGAPGVDRLPKPYLPAGARLDSLEGAGEVQSPIHYAGQERLSLGDPILLRHAKAGELCERFNELLLISGGEVIGQAATYRGDGQCFL